MSDNEQKNETRYTVADIVATVRRAAQYYDVEAEKSEGPLRKSFELSATSYREIANLVEAAWKREKAEIEADALSVGGIVEAARTAEKSSSVGNAAATREALEAMNRIDTKGLKRLLYELVEADIFDGGQINKTISAVEKARRALSAPARNCDLYVTRHEMSMAYEAYRKTAMKGYGNGLTGRVPTVKQKPMTYDEWMFALASERKGEGDA